MAYQPYQYGSYQGYYQPQMQDQLNQMRQNQMQQMVPQPQMVQPMPQAPNNSVIPSTQGNGILWVPNYSAAAEYLVAPNSAVALWDQNSPFVYLKQADSTGKPTLKVFELVERDPSQQQNKATEIQVPDLSRYITREELEEILTDRLKKPTRATGKKEEE